MNSIWENAEIIYAYTRAEALADGVLVDVSEKAREAGFKIPVAITKRVFDEAVNPSEEALSYGQSVSGRLWDILFLAGVKARANLTKSYFNYTVLVADGPGNARNIRLKAECGPDDKGEPIITIMFHDED